MTMDVLALVAEAAILQATAGAGAQAVELGKAIRRDPNIGRLVARVIELFRVMDGSETAADVLRRAIRVAREGFAHFKSNPTFAVWTCGPERNFLWIPECGILQDPEDKMNLWGGVASQKVLDTESSTPLDEQQLQIFWPVLSEIRLWAAGVYRLNQQNVLMKDAVDLLIMYVEAAAGCHMASKNLGLRVGIGLSLTHGVNPNTNEKILAGWHTSYTD